MKNLGKIVLAGSLTTGFGSCSLERSVSPINTETISPVNANEEFQKSKEEFLNYLTSQQRQIAEPFLNSLPIRRSPKATAQGLEQKVNEDSLDVIEQTITNASAWLGKSPGYGNVAQGQSFNLPFPSDLYSISVFLSNDGREDQGVRSPTERDTIKCELIKPVKITKEYFQGLDEKGNPVTIYGGDKVEEYDLIATSFSNAPAVTSDYYKPTLVTFQFNASLESGEYVFGVSIEDSQLGYFANSDGSSYKEGSRFTKLRRLSDKWFTDDDEWDSAFRISLLMRDPDFNRDGILDFTDFIGFAKHYNTTLQSSNWDPRYDLDKSGAVDFPDFLRFIDYYQRQ